MEKIVVPHFKRKISGWEDAAELQIASFPWYKEGTKQQTKVQLYRTDEAIHLLATAEDRWSSAIARELHGSVYLDSCFEFFFTPQLELGAPYLNLEFNCIGSMFVGFGPDVEHRATCSPQQAEQIKLITSLQGPIKKPTPHDVDWTIELEIPIGLIEELAGYRPSEEGWYVNFFRCGGEKEPQHACWNPIEWPHPSFHRPEQFGLMEFVKCR